MHCALIGWKSIAYGKRNDNVRITLLQLIVDKVVSRGEGEWPVHCALSNGMATELRILFVRRIFSCILLYTHKYAEKRGRRAAHPQKRQLH